MIVNIEPNDTQPTASLPLISVIFSFKNEEENIPELIRRTKDVLEGQIEAQIVRDYELIFVNDASTDRSLEMLLNFSLTNNRIKIINMSRNFGVFPCTFAGLRFSKGDLVVYMDADLQDPPEIIPKLLEKWKSDKDIDVVHTIRTDRAGESRFKLWITKMGYLLLNKISNIELPVEAGDFKLLSRRVVDHLLQFKEKLPYTKGLVCWVGYKQEKVFYSRERRFAGETKFPTLGLGAIANFTNSALISFSSAPLQIASLVGISGCLVSGLMIFHVLFEKFSGHSIPGWTAIMTAILFLGSVQLLTIGILGVYIHSIFIEVKERPNYIIESIHGFDKPLSMDAMLKNKNPHEQT